MRERCLRWPRPCRRYLEEEQLLDARYRLQEVAGGSVALPVLEVAEQRLRELQESGALELPCSLLRIQVGAARTRAQAGGSSEGFVAFLLVHIPPAEPHPLQGGQRADTCPEAAQRAAKDGAGLGRELVGGAGARRAPLVAAPRRPGPAERGQLQRCAVDEAG